jgi:hypothetical protein
MPISPVETPDLKESPFFFEVKGSGQVCHEQFHFSVVPRWNTARWNATLTA